MYKQGPLRIWREMRWLLAGLWERLLHLARSLQRMQPLAGSQESGSEETRRHDSWGEAGLPGQESRTSVSHGRHSHSGLCRCRIGIWKWVTASILPLGTSSSHSFENSSRWLRQCERMSNERERETRESTGRLSHFFPSGRFASREGSSLKSHCSWGWQWGRNTDQGKEGSVYSILAE